MNRRYFGTDGIRGLVGDHPMTPEFVLKLGWAAGRALSAERQGLVLIGKDTRLSGYVFESALQAGFASAGRPILERAWYVGGNTVRLNLLPDAIGSVLVQRGDRTPKGKMRGFSGDAHVAQATSMAAFGNFRDVR